MSSAISNFLKHSLTLNKKIYNVMVKIKLLLKKLCKCGPRTINQTCTRNTMENTN